jgi:hypothetical protein
MRPGLALNLSGHTASWYPAVGTGFWKNRGGQAIITTGASTGGVCNSVAWLRTYAPFQDLSLADRIRDESLLVKAQKRQNGLVDLLFVDFHGWPSWHAIILK